MSSRIFRFDDWTLNLQSGELERGGSRTRLQEHPLQVLASLLDSPGEVVTREQLIARLWPNTVVDFDTGLNTAVRKLRAALGDTADTPRYIETVPRRGYRFIGSVEETTPAPVPSAIPAPTAEPFGMAAPAGVAYPATAVAAATTLPRRRYLHVQVATLAALVLAFLLVWIARGSLRSLSTATSPGTSVSPKTAQFAPPPHSVAVLPFVNMSADHSQDYFSDGLSEEMLNALSRIDDLQVAAQTSSFYFKDKAVDLDTIAHKLNVATILEGSVRRSGQTVRITAQLVDAATGYRIWSETYDRNLDDALALQTDIANAVASTLKVKLLDDLAAKTGLGGTRNPQALDAYLRGLKLATATLRSGEEARQTLAAFSEAIRLDPDFALAYTGRALASVDYGSYFLLEATRDVVIGARDDALRAIALQPELGVAHAALGKALEVGFLDYAGAAKEFERALALSPGDARVLRAYSRFAGILGHTDVAITTAKRSIELDPLNVYAHRILGEAFEAARRYPESLAAFQDAIRLNPTHATEAYQRAGRLYYLMGDIRKAKESCEAEPDAYHMQDCMPLIYEKLGQHELAQAALATTMAAQGDYAAYQYAQIYAQWGQPDKALDWLENAVKIMDPGVESARTDPFMDPLRDQPRFQAFERRLNLPP